MVTALWLTGKITIFATIDPTSPNPQTHSQTWGWIASFGGGGESREPRSSVEVPLGCVHFSADVSIRT